MLIFNYPPSRNFMTYTSNTHNWLRNITTSTCFFSRPSSHQLLWVLFLYTFMYYVNNKNDGDDDELDIQKQEQRVYLRAVCYVAQNFIIKRRGNEWDDDWKRENNEISLSLSLLPFLKQNKNRRRMMKKKFSSRRLTIWKTAAGALHSTH